MLRQDIIEVKGMTFEFKNHCDNIPIFCMPLYL